MNAYEEKIEARKQRYEELSAKKEAESIALLNKAHKMASIIPFGQPILVGHHSEKSDRAYRNKIVNTDHKAYEASKTAEYYKDKASSVGTGGISSDDPEAVLKLSAKLEKLQKLQDRMRLANKAIRKNDKQALKDLGFSEESISELYTPNFLGGLGFASFQLSNNNAEIHRLERRIKNLQVNQTIAPIAEAHENYTYKEEDNRCQFVFDGKPSDAIRTLLKSFSFKWSPSRGSWVRQLTRNGQYAAGSVKDKINSIG